MFKELKQINTRPEPFQFYTAADLWADEHTSNQMLKYHLDDSVSLSSRSTKFINSSVEWLCSYFKVDANTSIADFGCGPGLYTIRLAEKNADVTGIDFSENSIKYAKESAKQKGLNINYVLQNYLEFEAEKKFDLIIMIMCDFCALSPEQRKKLLNKFYKLLNKSGSVLLDVNSLYSFDLRDETAIYEKNMLKNFWSPNDYYCFLNTFKYEKEKLVLDKYTIIEDSRIRTVYNWFQCFDQKSIEKEFKEAGFTIEDFFSDVAGKPFKEGADKKNMEIAGCSKKIVKNLQIAVQSIIYAQILRRLFMKKQTPIFVLSAGRTGSTLLAKMINRHPGLLCVSDLFEPVGEVPYFDAKRIVDGQEFFKILSLPSYKQRIKYWRKQPNAELLFLHEDDNMVSLLLSYTLPFLTDGKPMDLFHELQEETKQWEEDSMVSHTIRFFEWFAG